jgi:protein O-GlcNAc transferase
MPSSADNDQLILLHQAGRFAELESKASILVEKYPDYGIGWKMLGYALQMQGKNPLRAFRTAAELMPDEAEAQYCLAGSQKSFGLFREAVASYRRALQIKPDYFEAYCGLGDSLAVTGQLDEALANYHRALQIKPEYIDAHNKLGLALANLGLFESAASSFRRALQIKPDHAEILFNLGNALTELGLLDEAVTSYQRALQIEPEFVDAHNRLGIALKKLGRFAEAKNQYICALELRPDLADAHFNLGTILDELGQLSEAMESYRRAVELKPDFAEAHNSLGSVLKSLGRHEEARASIRLAAQINYKLAETHNNLGTTLVAAGQINSAIANFRRAVKLNPDSLRAHINLGNALRTRRQPDEAALVFRRALKLNPENAALHINLGTTLKDIGQLDEAVACYRRALELKPDDPLTLSNLLFTLNYTDHSPEFLLEEARKYGRLVDDRRKLRFSTWKCPYESSRLKVGVVSGDLYNHPVVYFLESFLAQLDPGIIELIAYTTSQKSDATTARIKSRFTAWKSISGLSDEAAANLIHNDCVQVLIDISGHTGHNRLPVFAWKPAPVQVSWLGYFATTGVAEIDYLLADKVGVPESQRQYFTESIWYLPDSRLCFTAPDLDLPVAPLPALSKGTITFGCFQTLAKINDSVLAVWGNIFASVPTAMLRIQSNQLGEPAHKEQLGQRLQRVGINPERVTLHDVINRENYFAAHAEVDVILDTFPYPGGTTTCEALWMGVPTLTLADDSLLGRQGASLLTAAGLEDWITTDKAEYITKAIAVAGDLQKLSSLRAKLRPQVLASPLFDAPRFARNFEDALMEMWQTWKGKKNNCCDPDA